MAAPAVRPRPSCGRCSAWPSVCTAWPTIWAFSISPTNRSKRIRLRLGTYLHLTGIRQMKNKFLGFVLFLSAMLAAQAADPTSMEGFLEYGTTQLGLLKTFGIAVGVVAIGWTTFRLVKSWLGRAK